MITDALKLSLLSSFCATCAIAVIGTGLAYVLTRRAFPGKTLLDAVITLPLILPPTVTGYYLIVFLGRQGILGEYLGELFGVSVSFTLLGAVIASFVCALPIMVKAVAAALQLVDSEYEDAARTMGKSEWKVFITITLPLAKWGILAGLVLAFARTIGEFGATLMLAGNIPGTTQTMPLAIFEAFASGDDTQAMMMVGILTAISITVIVITQRLIKEAKH